MHQKNIFCFRFFSSLVCYDLLKPVLYCIRDLCQYQKYIKGSRFEPVRTQFSLLQYATNLEPNLRAELQNQNRLGPNLQFSSEVHGPNRGSGPNFGNPICDSAPHLCSFTHVLHRSLSQRFHILVSSPCAPLHSVFRSAPRAMFVFLTAIPTVSRPCFRARFQARFRLLPTTFPTTFQARFRARFDRVSCYS